MSELPSHRVFPGDARLAAYATGASPVWLWSTDGTRVLWANSVAAAIFNASTAAALADRRFEPREQIATQIARVAGSLSHGGVPRLERLRGFGTGFGRALLCACSRLILADRTRAVLVVAKEPAGPALTLAERVRRLFCDIVDDSAGPAVAVFAPEGTLLYASAEGARRLAGTTSLAAFGAADIGAHALATGRAGGTTALGSLEVERLGSGADAVLAAVFAAIPRETQRTVEDAPAPTLAEPASPCAADAPAMRPDTAIEFASDVAPPLVPATHEEHAVVEPTPAAEDETDSSSETTAPPDQAFFDGNSFIGAFETHIETHTEPESKTATGSEGPEIPPLSIDIPIAERRHPLRFVWQMDTEGRFNLGSDEFTEVIGPKIAIALGRPWSEVAAELALDPEGQVERAVATRDTWSGITLSWPVDGTEERLKVELSGLPIYDRSRVFLGYRGFGVCRDIDRINVLAQMRRRAPVFTAERPDADSPPAAAVAGARHDADVAQRPPLTLVPSAKNVVPFRSANITADVRSPALSPVERNAFRELARQLTARLKGQNADGEAPDLPDLEPMTAEPDAPSAEDHFAAAAAITAREAALARGASVTASERPLLDRLPVGILVYRFDQLLYANRAFLDWTGYEDLMALTDAGGLDSLFVEGGLSAPGEITGPGKSIAIAANSGDKLPVEGRLFSIPWNGEPALVLMLVTSAIDDGARATELPLRLAESEAGELRSIVDAATDGILIIDRDGRILSCNRSAAALFSRDAADLTNMVFIDLFVPDSRRTAVQSLEGLAHDPSATAAQGCEVAGRVGDVGQIPLFMTMSRIAGASERFCLVLRDITPWKNSERELSAAKEHAEKASTAKSEFLAKISHEIRTPLNSIIGFTEVMIEERFGPIGNERYREYLKDIRASGTHAVSLLNDLLDLSKIEAGQLELTFVGVRLNEMVQSCVGLMQPQANREHIIIRTSLLPSLRPVIADARAVRQIVLNLLSNSIKFTTAGGQVIVSTAQSDDGSVVLRVRDTGIGMSETDLGAALEPFRQLPTSSRWGSSSSGLGLPLTKALAEANHATFAISSKVHDGTLVEIAFSAARIIAE